MIVKHANPCGVSSRNKLIDAYEKAFETDKTSAFGGVIAFNKDVDENLARKILENQFVEIIISPSFSKESLEIFKSKKDIRIIEYKDYKDINESKNVQIKSINDGILIQNEDINYEVIIDDIVSKKEPTKEELLDLKFSWIVSKFVKSNAIVFSKNQQTLGIGAGQMSRIDSTFIASEKAKVQGLNLVGASMASDAFFPFTDNVEKANKLGISSIIQPGGSKNDKEVISKVNELGMSMVFTGKRHFRH